MSMLVLILSMTALACIAVAVVAWYSPRAMSNDEFSEQAIAEFPPYRDTDPK